METDQMRSSSFFKKPAESPFRARANGRIDSTLTLENMPPLPLAMSTPWSVELHEPHAALDIVVKVELCQFYNVFLRNRWK